MGTWVGDVAELPDELPGPVPPAQPARVSLRVEVGVAALVVVVLAVAGVGVGFVWSTVSRHVPVVIGTDGPRVQAGGGDDVLFAAEGTFALIGIVTGLLCGIGIWYAARRWRGPLLLGAVAFGGLAGALVAWQVGRNLGLAQYQELLRIAEVGREFSRPVNVRAKGLLVIQPLVATAAYVVLAFWTSQPDLRQPDSGVNGGTQPPA